MTGNPRNCTSTCASAEGCKTQLMMGSEFRKLADSSPELKESLHDLCLRRDFKKAVVLRLQKEFPYDNPRSAFDAICPPGNDGLDVLTVGRLMRDMDPSLTDDDILDFFRTVNLRKSGKITYDEFEKVFIADIRKSAAI